MEGAEWGTYDPFASDSLFESISDWTSYASTLFFVLWLAGLLFVAFRYRAEKQQAQVRQEILHEVDDKGSTKAG